MSDPTTPNFKKNIGRLATDRFDFEDHVEGIRFRHKADQIDIFPTLIIGSGPGVTVHNIQEAIVALNNVVTPPVIQDATTSVKGIVQLAGDIGGISSNVVVIRLQTHPVSSLTPVGGDVLTWNGVSNIWEPTASNSSFTASGDLTGDNILQQVIGLSGSGTLKIVTASANVINFSSNTTPTITETTNSLNNGNDIVIRAQSAASSNKNGGSVIISGGVNGTSGVKGSVKLQLTSTLPAGYPTTALTPITSFNVLQVAELPTGRRILSLCNPNDLTVFDMPTDTGDMVMFVKNAVTIPNTGNPSNGAILYATGGQLWTKQQDGNNFSIGSIPNPSIWGSTGQQTYTSRNYVTSTTSSTLAFSFNLQDQTATRVDAIFIGKKVGGADSAQFNLSIGYVRHGGSPVIVGTLTNADSRSTAGASGWTIPNITVSGNTLQVFTGFSGSTNINWLVTTQLSISQG